MTASGLTLSGMLMAALIIGACAAQEEQRSSQSRTQAVRDFIEVRQLQELDAARSGNGDSWTGVADNFVLYTGRGRAYLFETVRRCRASRIDQHYSAGKHWELGRIRAKFDEINDCRIETIYALSAADVAELEKIGAAPGEYYP